MEKGLYLSTLVFIFLINLVSSDIGVLGSDGKNYSIVNQGEDFEYNLMIRNNQQIGSNLYVTQVNIILPTHLKFKQGTEYTNALYENFSNTSSVLSWSNLTGFLIAEEETKNFKFTANTNTEDNFTIGIWARDPSGQSISEFYVNINLTQSPLGCVSNWTCTDWSDCTGGFQTRTCEDENECENESGKPLERGYCSSTECVQKWNCTKWSECIGESQIRSCVDTNLCGNNSQKPLESQSCTPTTNCISQWSCGEWSKCIENSQIRTCADINKCGEYETKQETKNCKRDALLIFIIIVIILITITIIVTIITIETIRKNSYEKIETQ
ncbi:MAG: hypothetical protein ABH811_01540 [archaeon]